MDRYGCRCRDKEIDIKIVVDYTHKYVIIHWQTGMQYNHYWGIADIPRYCWFVVQLIVSFWKKEQRGRLGIQFLIIESNYPLIIFP